MAKKRIIVIDDEPLIPILMREIIEDDPDIEIASIATDKAKFLDLLSRHSFDAALVDISFGGMEGGIELLRILKERDIYLPAVVLSAHDEIDYALKCLQAGARGYINKRYICTDLTRALQEVFNGNLFVSGDRSAYILNKYKIASVAFPPVFK